jgi:hypothetical protein
LGAAVVSCDGCDSDTSLGFDFMAGAFINPRLALMYDVAAYMDF